MIKIVMKDDNDDYGVIMMIMVLKIDQNSNLKDR